MRSGMRRNQDKESGTTAIEFVVFTPLLFLLMFGSVQVGLALFARHVAVTAAQEGARTAREQAANPNADWQTLSIQASNGWVTSLLGHLVEGGPNFSTPFVQVPLTDPYPEVGTTVQFSIASVVPGWTFSVNAQSVGPVECFYIPDGHCNGY